jgi:uncharacterized protein
MVRLNSGSLWTGVILYASNNHFIQQFFDLMTAYTGPHEIYPRRVRHRINPCNGCASRLFWMRRAEVAQPR